MKISAQTWEFIRSHRNDDVRDLALHAGRDGSEIDMPFALDQIAGWQRARTKLPEWAARDGVIYPPHISIEQCSSQSTAQYKASVARTVTGSQEPRGTLVDLTGGFGVDFSYMARGFAHATYVERQSHLCEIAEHNMRALGLDHVMIVNGDAEEYLAGMPDRSATRWGDPSDATEPTFIFLDPARRDAHGARTYAIADCMPDVLALKSMLLSKADWVMVKLSPMLDWRKTMADLGSCVREVHIVSAGNECKELLVVLASPRTRHDASEAAEEHSIRMVCVNDDDVLEYMVDAEGRILNTEATNVVSTEADPIGSARSEESEPRYLFEPNASIMKAGCFDLLERRYARHGLRQIGPNSHLFTSAEPIPGFPGRAFLIDRITGMGKKELKSALAGITHANIAVRNFPMPVATLRKKLKLKDGGDTYIFATTTASGQHTLMITRKPTNS
ncbi:DNA methyltransferase [Bifidobacterium tissieri]|uniref:DNA methyltransferase n=1 Tax=Bifidobacterium tissieri TaxID=1630162 RepID=A0A261FDP0_9BIFI|nr:SAM-dependent methyltransferase [Bifidobacterium tissieri]OZG57290.1 DNA methyltransferase [Bifidobacterium tissieri]